MKLFLNKQSKNTTTRLILSFTFLFAGFSQLVISSVKISDILLVLTCVTLIINVKFQPKPIFIFFIFSFIYAWYLGELTDIKTLLSSSIIFIIIFSLIDYFKIKGQNEIDYFIKLFIYSMFLSNAIAIFLFLFLTEFKELVVDVSSIGVRFKGFFNQSNGYAYVLLINFPLALYLLNKKKNLFNIINVIMILICLLLAQSRGAIFSLLIGLLIVYLIYLIRSRKITSIIAPALLFLTIGYFILTTIPSYLSENFGVNLSRLNPTSQKASERNLSDLKMGNLEEDRFYLIHAGVKTFEEYPFGLGFQEQHIIIGRITGVYLIPHNFYLTLFLTYGLIIGFIWMLIIFFLIWKGIRKLYHERISPDHLFFYLIAMVLMIGLFYLTHSSDWSYFYFLIAMYYVILNEKVNLKINK